MDRNHDSGRSSKKPFVLKRPFSLALFFVVFFDVFFLGSGYVAAAIYPTAPSIALTVVSETSGLVLSLAILIRFHWFRKVGYNGPNDWRDLRVLWVPTVVVIFLMLSVVTIGRSIPFLSAVSLALSSILIGFTEETAFRGIVLQSLLSYGTRNAVMASALLFGVLHLNHLIQAGGGAEANLQSSLVAVAFAFLTGIGLAAFRIRTNTIWPVVIFHGLSDIPGLLIEYTTGYSDFFNPPTAALEITLGAILAGYGLFLLRSKHVQIK